MASAAPKAVASLPLYTVVALCGFITEVLMRLLNGVAGEPACAVLHHLAFCKSYCNENKLICLLPVGGSSSAGLMPRTEAPALVNVASS